MVSPRASKKNTTNQGHIPRAAILNKLANSPQQRASGNFECTLNACVSEFEIRGYSKKHGRRRRWGMRDLNEIRTSMGQTMGG